MIKYILHVVKINQLDFSSSELNCKYQRNGYILIRGISHLLTINRAFEAHIFCDALKIM